MPMQRAQSAAIGYTLELYTMKFRAVLMAKVTLE
jgi:hypothetical protein